jgi:hypothetical protein
MTKTKDGTGTMAIPLGDKCRDVRGVEIKVGAEVVIATWRERGPGLRVSRVRKVERMPTIDQSRVWIEDNDQGFYWSDDVAVVGALTRDDVEI